MTETVKRWEATLSRIKDAALQAGRDPQSIKLIAVSKKHPLAVIEELYHAGQRDFGENYVQELVSKAEGAQKLGLSEIRWHFIGHLQRNKVKPLLPWVYRIHSVDSSALVTQIAKRWQELHRPFALPILIEVNVSGEESKSGVSPSLLLDLAESVKTHVDALDLKGLMCIPSSEQTRALSAFETLASLGASLKLEPSQLELSMGMSGDFEKAIEAGATWIRVGTAIFGAR